MREDTDDVRKYVNVKLYLRLFPHCHWNGTDKANEQLFLHNKKEDAFWQQKAGLRWFKEGDTNSKFFDTMIKAKRRRLSLKGMKDSDNNKVMMLLLKSP